MEEQSDGAQRLRLWDRATLDDEDWLIPLPISEQRDGASIAKRADPPRGVDERRRSFSYA